MTAPVSPAPPLLVALVEDDPALRDATHQTLSLEGAEVVAFADARAALGWLTPDFPGVVVSDVRMPGIDGIAFFAELRRIDPDLPVILTTGHGDIAMAVAAAVCARRPGARSAMPSRASRRWRSAFAR